MKSHIYLSEKVLNRDPKFGATTEYFPATVRGDGETYQALFTKDQLKVAIERAKKNPEDFPKPWWQKLTATLVNAWRKIP